MSAISRIRGIRQQLKEMGIELVDFGLEYGINLDAVEELLERLEEARAPR